MKSILFSFLAYAASVAAMDAVPVAIDEKIRAEITNGVRGRKSPVDMNKEEREREALFLCGIINTVLPGDLSCDCTREILGGKLGFQCGMGNAQCVGAGDIGSVCSKIEIGGEVNLLLLELAAGVSVNACAREVSLNSTALGTEGLPLGDICLSIGAKAGLSGVGITECTATFVGNECTACKNCPRGNNATGIGFSCEGLPLDICIPISIPIFVDDINPELSASQITDPVVWEDAVNEFAKQVAIEKYAEIHSRKLAEK